MIFVGHFECIHGIPTVHVASAVRVRRIEIEKCIRPLVLLNDINRVSILNYNAS